MTARLSESAAAAHRMMRVVSVSPLTACTHEPCTNDDGADDEHRMRLCSVQPADHEDDIVALTRRADQVLASLQSVLEEAALGDIRVRDSVRSLQDRLRVSARMLQAFQSQIARIETGIDQLQQQREISQHAVAADAARLDDQAAAFEQRLEAALEHFERRLAELGRVS